MLNKYAWADRLCTAFKHVAVISNRFILLLLLSVSLNLQATADEKNNSNRYSEWVQSESFKRHVLTRDKLLQNASLTSIRLSPNGKSLAYIEKHLGANNKPLETLWIRGVEAETSSTNEAINKALKSSAITSSASSKALFTSKQVGNLHWSKNSQIIFVQQRDKLLAVPANGSARASIVYRLQAESDERWLRVNPHSPSQMLLLGRMPHHSQHYLKSVDESGNTAVIYTSENEILDVLLSQDSNGLAVRVSLESIDGVKHLLNIRSNTSEKEKPTVAVCEVHDPCDLLYFNSKTQVAYLLARLDQDLISLFSLDLNEHASLGKPILVHQDPGQRFDISDVYFSNSQPQIAKYERYFTEYFALNESAAAGLHKVQKQVEKAGARYFNLALSDDLRHWLVDYKPATESLQQLVLLRDTAFFPIGEALYKQHGLYPSAHHSSPSDKRISSERRVVKYQVSDGMQQFGYITLPSQAQLINGVGLQDLPLIVNPHGGPWSRSFGSYNRMADFIASRGYLVFEPNFRASSGMGKGYMSAANKDFGKGRVHQDILDGMQAVLNMGYGNPDKKAIVGHSFGGFSALGGLSFTPTLFDMAFAGAPPVDLVHSIEYLSRQDFLNKNAQRHLMLQTFAVDIDDPVDSTRLSSQSPGAYLKDIQKPVYIWAGLHDDRVDIRKVKQYVSQLRDKNKLLKFFVDPYSSHSPSNQLAFDAYLFMLEHALHTHFGGGFDSQQSNYLRRYILSNTVVDTL